MPRQFWAECVAWDVADGTAVTANAVETVVFPDVTISGAFMNTERNLAVEAWGRFSTTTGPPTLRLRLRWGGVAGVVLADSGTITTVASVTNAIWMCYVRMQTRANGSSGTVMAIGMAVLFGAVASTVGSTTGAPGIAPMGSAGITAPATATVDLTIDKALSLTALWSTASNSLTGHTRFIDVWN
jgi:hypothetical protein